MDISKLSKEEIDIPNEYNSSVIKVGSYVVFIDGSYTLSISEGKLQHLYMGLNNEIHKVVAINVTVLTHNKGPLIDHLVDHGNNCIVESPTGMITFCSSINIRNIKHRGDSEPFRLKN